MPGIGEEGRPLGATVDYVRKGQELRQKFEAELKRRAEAEGDAAVASEVNGALADRDAAKKHLAEVLAAPLATMRASSPLAQEILAEKAKVEKAG